MTSALRTSRIALQCDESRSAPQSGRPTLTARAIAAPLVAVLLFTASGQVFAGSWKYYYNHRHLYPPQGWSASFVDLNHAKTEARRACSLGVKVLAIRNFSTGQTFSFSCRPKGAGRTLAEYKRAVEDAYQRARYLRSWASHNVGRLTRQQFNAVNAQITKYNQVLQSAQSAYPNTFRSSRPMSQIPSSWIASPRRYDLQYLPRSGGNRWTTMARYSRQDWALRAKATYERKYGRRYHFRVVAR